MSTSGHPITIPTPSAANGVKFNPPTLFDGQYRNFRQFQRELEIFLSGYRITDDQTMILTTLSFMRGGYADEFCQEIVNTAISQSLTDWGTWDDFRTKLEDRFRDKNFRKDRREHLEHFRQTKMLVDEYFTKLDMLFADAGVTDDAEKIRLLEKGLNSDILETIYTSDNPIPSTYDQYKKKAIQLGRMRERFRQSHRAVVASLPSASTPAKPVHQFHTHIHPPVTEKKTATGITYGGKGQPMDIGETRQPLRCFNCGELGHMRKDCPKERTKMNVRVLMASLDEEELEELRAEMELKDQDFADGR
jgi:hypothetical protein